MTSSGFINPKVTLKPPARVCTEYSIPVIKEKVKERKRLKPTLLSTEFQKWISHKGLYCCIFPEHSKGHSAVSSSPLCVKCPFCTWHPAIREVIGICAHSRTARDLLSDRKLMVYLSCWKAISLPLPITILHLASDKKNKKTLLPPSVKVLYLQYII